MIAVDLRRYFRITFIHVVPCILLVGLNARLFVAMRRAHEHHRRLLRENLNAESRRLAETNMATLMLLVVVGVFLLVELPLAVMMMTMIVENTFHPLMLMDPGARRTATLVTNLTILFSYPLNFFIYCGMSHQFRQTFCRLFGGQAAVVVVSEAPTRPSISRSRCADVNDDDEGDGDVRCDRMAALLSVEQMNACTAESTRMSDLKFDNS